MDIMKWIAEGDTFFVEQKLARNGAFCMHARSPLIIDTYGCYKIIGGCLPEELSNWEAQGFVSHDIWMRCDDVGKVHPRVHKAVQADIESYLNILHYISAPKSFPDEECVNQFFAQPSTLFVIKENNEVVAALTLLIVKGYPARIEEVVTHPNYRGKGYASALIQTALAHVQGSIDLGCKTELVSFYEKNGFIVQGIGLRKNL